MVFLGFLRPMRVDTLVTTIGGRAEMKTKRVPVNLIALAFLTVSVALALAAQDKYTVKVPGGLGFAEFRGYEDWQPVGPSLTDAQNVIRVIVANPVMIQAYREGVPGNGKPFPERIQHCHDLIDAENNHPP